MIRLTEVLGFGAHGWRNLYRHGRKLRHRQGDGAALARMGANVVMVSRDRARGEAGYATTSEGHLPRRRSLLGGSFVPFSDTTGSLTFWPRARASTCS
jgi:hypothetical protein